MNKEYLLYYECLSKLKRVNFKFNISPDHFTQSSIGKVAEPSRPRRGVENHNLRYSGYLATVSSLC